MEVGAGKRSGGERTWQTFITGPLLGLRMAFSARRIKRERKGDLRDDEKERERKSERERNVESEVYIIEVYILFSKRRRRREGGFSIRRWKRNNTWPITYIKVENDRAQTQSSFSALGGHCALAKVITIFFLLSPPPLTLPSTNNRRIFTRDEERIVW